MINTTDPDRSLLGERNRLAGFLCLFGVFLHIVLSDPLLNAIGIHYSALEGNFYEKVHVGTFFIYLSLVVLLLSGGSVIRRIIIIYREHRVYSMMLWFSIFLFIYLSVKSGPEGFAFILDTHISMAICPVVLCYAPLSYCRRAVHLFVFIALINSATGIAESVGRFRIFTFDADWSVLHEENFRASAFRGHPLSNAVFTVVALFVAMSWRYPIILKAIMVIIFETSLVAFGGRSGLGFSVLGLGSLGALTLYKFFTSRNATMFQVFFAATAALVIPIVFMAGLFLAINSSLGERILTHAKWDESADSREVAFSAFHHMNDDELAFGVTNKRTVDILARMNIAFPLADIENPWLLMLIFLGYIVFPIWLGMTGLLVWRLMKDRPLALKLAVISYFAVASTFNSFGRKESTYLIMVSIVTCAGRALEEPRRKPEPEIAVPHFSNGVPRFMGA